MKARQTGLGRFVWRRFAEPARLRCDRCDKVKMTETEVEWRRPGVASFDTICNGCYGALVSTG
jgi:hypothetical protein